MHIQGDATWQMQPMSKGESSGNTLTLTIWEEQEQTFTVEQASQMLLPDFGKIWQVLHTLALLTRPCHAKQADKWIWPRLLQHTAIFLPTVLRHA